MKLYKTNYLSLFLLFALNSLPVYAEPYAGIGISRVDGSTSGGGDAGDANGLLIYGGNRFENVGFEFGYSDVGDIDVPQTSAVITGSIFKTQASFFADLATEFQLFAKLGISIPDLESNVGYSYNDTEFAWALGMNYQFSNRLAIRVEYEEYDDLDGLNLNLLSFSLNTNFN